MGQALSAIGSSGAASGAASSTGSSGSSSGLGQAAIDALSKRQSTQGTSSPMGAEQDGAAARAAIQAMLNS